LDSFAGSWTGSWRLNEFKPTLPQKARVGWGTRLLSEGIRESLCVSVSLCLCGENTWAGLVHPARLRSAILLLVLFRGDVVAQFVELYLTVMLPHVDFEFACCPAALPAVVGIV